MKNDEDKLEIARLATSQIAEEPADELKSDTEEETEPKHKRRWKLDQPEPQPRCVRRGLVTDAPLTLKI